jgi:hypothetical protein
MTSFEISARPSPAQTARDLRNAALVMDTLGWCVGDWIEPDTAQVCLDGALELATGAPLLAEYIFGAEVIFLSGGSPTDEESLSRYAAAQEAVAALLPPCPCAHGEPLKVPANAVVHYNDAHCTGGEEASLLLIEAAEKLEADL